MKEVKLLLLGDVCAGKTALCVAYVENRLYLEYVPTVFENYEKIVNIDSKLYHLTLWDTAGHEDYDRLRPLSYPSTDVVIVVFSVESPSSYKNVIAKWIPEVRHHMPNTPIVLVGSQIDLRADPNCLKRLAEHKLKPITTEMGEKLALEINAAAYVESSFLDQRSVKNVFEKSITTSAAFQDKTPSLHIFMMGDSNVGKNALTDAYLDNEFNLNPRHPPKHYRFARLLIDDEQCIIHMKPVEVLDVILCSAVILVFSVNDLQSYNNILAKWIPKVKQHCPSAPVILVGNKTDLREKGSDTVTTEMSKHLAQEINAVAYFECSCRDGRTVTIEQIFETAARASYFVKVKKFLKKSNKTLFKVHLTGDVNVGKSSLQNRFQVTERLDEFNKHLNVVDQSFNARWHPDYSFAGFTEIDGEECGWIICNGLSDWKTTKHSDKYLLKKDRGIDVFVLMFSVVDFDSYLSIEKKWIPELQKLKHFNPQIPLVLVGNKTDLRGNAKQHISTEMGEQLALTINAAKYLECSSVDGEEVERVFEETAWASLRYAEERRKLKSQWFRKLFGRK